MFREFLTWKLTLNIPFVFKRQCNPRRWIRQNCHLLYKRSRKAVFQCRYVEDLHSGIPILCLVSVIYFWGNNVVLNADKLTTIKYSLVPAYYTASGLCHNPYVYLTSPYFEGKHFIHMTWRLVVLPPDHHFKVFSSMDPYLGSGRNTWTLGAYLTWNGSLYRYY